MSVSPVKLTSIRVSTRSTRFRSLSVPLTVCLPAVKAITRLPRTVETVAVVMLAAAPLRKPCGVNQMLSAPASVRPSVVWFWMMSPGMGRIPPCPVPGLKPPAPPPRVGSWLSIRTSSCRIAGTAKFTDIVYFVTVNRGQGPPDVNACPVGFTDPVPKY